MVPQGTGWTWGHSHAGTSVQPHLLCSTSPKTLNPKSVDLVRSYISQRCFQHVSLAVCPLPFPHSSQLQLWLLVILSLSFSQTLMIFLYAGINRGNGPQWLKLNYSHTSPVQRSREGQFSPKLHAEFGEWEYSTIWRKAWQGTSRNRRGEKKNAELKSKRENMLA